MIYPFLFSTLSTLIMGIALLLHWRNYPAARFSRYLGIVYVAWSATPALLYVSRLVGEAGHAVAVALTILLSGLTITYLLLGVANLADRRLSRWQVAGVSTVVCAAGLESTLQADWSTAALVIAAFVLGSGLVAWRWLGSSSRSDRWVGPLLCLIGLDQIPLYLWGFEAFAAQVTVNSLLRIILGLLLLQSALERSRAEADRLDEHYERLTLNSHQGVTVGYAQEIVFCNPAFLKIYGAESLQDITPEWINAGIPVQELEGITKMRGQILDGTLTEARFEGVRRRKDGTPLHLRFAVWRTEWNDQPAIHTVITDDTAQHDTMTAMLHQATHDELTGLPNRALLLRQLRERCQAQVPDHARFGLVLLDIDRFKLFNDAHGHSLGDQVLKAMAAKLVDGLSDVGEVSRMGSDGFAVLTQVGMGADLSNEVAQRVRQMLTWPLALPAQEFFVDMSMGVALFPQSAQDPEGLLRAANAALHEAKKVPGTSVVLAEERFERGSSEVLGQEQALRAGIAQEEFSLAYQPKVDAHTGELKGFEALARWHRDGIGYVNPMQFIAAAERTGLIGALGLLLLNKACRQVALWMAKNERVVPVAVNVSPFQMLDPGFPQRVGDALERQGVPGHLITLEITESAAIDNMGQARQQIMQLGTLGIKVAMDDFGTGFSSLDMLRTLPLDVVKIDRSLISPMPAADAIAITQAICQIASALKLRVVAEGVETAEQSRAAQMAGCHEIQGYFYAKPLTPSQAEQWLHAGGRP